MKIKYIILFFLCASIDLFSQEIFIKRSDVDSARSGFVTASYSFTIDIYISNLKNSNGVAFELQYNLPKYIKFSQWRIGDYNAPNVPQIVSFSQSDNLGKIVVGVGSGNFPLPDSIDTPKVISIEFVTLQNAPNDFDNIFSFNSPVASVIDSNGRSIIPLNAEDTKYNIHGYVFVWPGDTDNNGIVNHLDFAVVTQYVGLGSSTKNMKSFKRESGSAIWGPHRCLVWDSALATYADCDGNGDITVNDMLIVTYNLGKTKYTPSINQEINNELCNYPEPNYYDLSEYDRFPLYLEGINRYYAISGAIDISNFNQDVVGVEIGNIFENNPFNYSIIRNNILYFCVGSYSRDLSYSEGILANIVKNNDLNIKLEKYITELKGIDEAGNIVDILNESTSSVNESNISMYDLQNLINLSDEIYIYDILGNQVIDTNNILKLENLKNGCYFVKINNRFKKLMVNR